MALIKDIPADIIMIKDPSQRRRDCLLFLNGPFGKIYYPLLDDKELLELKEMLCPDMNNIWKDDNVLEYRNVKFNFSQRSLSIENTDLRFNKDWIKIKKTDKDDRKFPKLGKRTPAVLCTLCLVLENLKENNATTLRDFYIYKKYRKIFWKSTLKEEPK